MSIVGVTLAWLQFVGVMKPRDNEKSEFTHRCLRILPRLNLALQGGNSGVLYLGGIMDLKIPGLRTAQVKDGFKVVLLPGDGSMTDTKTFGPMNVPRDAFRVE